MNTLHQYKLSIYIFFLVPLDHPLIVGHHNGSVVNAEVGVPLTLTCRADHGKPAFLLTWTKKALSSAAKNITHDVR